MRVYSEYSQGVLYLRLEGELDHHTAAETLRSIEQLIDRYLPRKCALDLSSLTFMDSSGVALFLRAQRRMRYSLGQLWLIDPSEQSGRVLKASGIERLIQIHYTESRKMR